MLYKLNCKYQNSTLDSTRHGLLSTKTSLLKCIPYFNVQTRSMFMFKKGRNIVPPYLHHKQNYATHAIRNPGLINKSHTISQKENPEVALRDNNGNIIGYKRHPEHLLGLCKNADCKNHVCTSLCNVSDKVQATGAHTHNKTVKGVVKSSNTDLNGETYEQYFKKYSQPYDVSKTEVKEDYKKTDNLNDNKEMLKNIHKTLNETKDDI